MSYWKKSLLSVVAYVVPALVIWMIASAASPTAGNAAYLVMFFVGLVLLIRYLILGSPLLPWQAQAIGGAAADSRESETVGSAAKWRVSVAIAAFSWGIPAISVIAATQGPNRSALIADFLGPTSQGFWGVPEGLCLVGIPTLVLLVPARLHTIRRERKDDPPVTGWLAGAAAVLTAVSLVILHYGGGALAEVPLGILSFAAFGAAVLLAPFYRVVANACWDDGLTAALDAAAWWREWCRAWTELRGALGDQAAPGDQAARPEVAHAQPNVK